MENLIFVTGGSGHIGSRIIITALEAGYWVRAAIRNQSKERQILTSPSIRALNPGRKLSFMVVPDLAVDGAYDEAVQGATYIIHVASPITCKEGETHKTSLIVPTVMGTLNILEAAKKTRSVRRVVITSSAIALLSWERFTSGSAGTVNEKSRTPSLPGPYGDAVEAYGASKIAALNETERWMKLEKEFISFDVVNIFPSFVIGKNELVTDATDALRGSNALVLGPITGKEMNYIPGVSVHVRDVALAHVKSLDAKVPGNRGYLLTSGGVVGTRWEDVFDTVARHFPDAIAAGTLPNSGRRWMHLHRRRL
jgi:nucleoside-diphosphate-sugar epimerase